MSVVHGSPVAQDRPDRSIPLAGWLLWTVPRPLRIYVLVNVAAAVSVIAASATVIPVQDRHLVWFAVLAVLGALHLEGTRRLERLRELATEGTTFTNMSSVWTFAGLLVLPPPLVAALIVIAYTHMWFRVSGRIVAHRWVLTAATVVLASGAGGLVLAAVHGVGYPGLPQGWGGMLVVLAAALARWLVNSVLIVAALMLITPGTTLRKALGSPADEFVEWTSLSLGAGVAALLTFDAPYLVVFVVPVLAVHRGLLLNHFRHGSRTDDTTGLLAATFWHELAGKRLERSHRLTTTAGLLLIDLDGFKAINDRYGPSVGDRVLRRVADTLRGTVGEDDLVGRLAGEEFAILAPEITAAELTALAERIRLAVSRLRIDTGTASEPTTVSGLTVSIGGASYPDIAGTLESLLMAADNALFVAKSTGRGQARVVAAGSQP